jgi:hypothetical protein
MAKKILLLIIGIILIIIGIMVFIYFKVGTNADGTPKDSAFKNFFPFGVSSGTTNQNNNGVTTDNTTTEGVSDGGATVPKESLKQITNFPVAGGMAFIYERETIKVKDEATGQREKLVEKVPAIKYVRSSNSHVYRMELDNKQGVEISTSTIPAIYEATFDSSGNYVVYRYLSELGTSIESFMGMIGTQNGQYLPENIIAIASAPSGNSFFYLTKDQSGGAVGTVFTPVGSKTTKIFTSPFSEWNIEWPGVSNVYLTTKPSGDVEGSVYSLNTTTGLFSKILGNIKGLTTKVSQDGNHIIYSKTTTSGPKLFVYNLRDHSTSDLAVYTFADKCVFSINTVDAFCAVPNTIPSIENPDLWYQGLDSYNDSIYKVNTNTGSISLVINTENTSPIDATNLFLDKTERFLLFTNKKDSTLWSLDLSK